RFLLQKQRKQVCAPLIQMAAAVHADEHRCIKTASMVLRCSYGQIAFKHLHKVLATLSVEQPSLRFPVQPPHVEGTVGVAHDLALCGPTPDEELTNLTGLKEPTLLHNRRV